MKMDQSQEIGKTSANIELCMITFEIEDLFSIFRSRSRSRSRERRDKKSRDRRRSRSRSRDRRDRDRRERRRSRSRSKDRQRRRSRERSRERRRSPRRSPPRFGGGSRYGRESPPPKKEYSPDVNLTPEERDARTIFVMQLSQRVRSRDVEEFFSSVGIIKDVRLIVCNKTRRFKGIAYVEFKEIDSVALVSF